ncbi:MAG TPA: hypothetical protein VJB94_01565 [Candidatus Nanoarchaeia archaeon]|nr:hypothetical protein [Candidatus Nanoarchaeia archaeon]
MNNNLNDKVKHLELIQSIINRMATNSFILKGWSVTLVTGIIILSLNNSIKNFIYLGLVPTLIFWGLDAYYLKQERLFRKLYDGVRCNMKGIEPFSLDTRLFNNGFKAWLCCFFSFTLLALHFAIVLIILITGDYHG